MFSIDDSGGHRQETSRRTRGDPRTFFECGGVVRRAQTGARRIVATAAKARMQADLHQNLILRSLARYLDESPQSTNLRFRTPKTHTMCCLLYWF